MRECYCPECRGKEITEKDNSASTKMYIDADKIDELLGRVQLLEQQMNQIINIAINEEKMIMQIKNIGNRKESKI